MVASVKHMKNRNDAVHKIVTNVMSIEVPPEGQLVNPFKPKRRQSSQVTLDEMITKKAPVELPEDVSQWTNKNFVTYFARKYQSYIGGNYKITFTSDLPIIKQIGDFFFSNGLDRNQYTKKLFDWAFDNSEQIIRKYNYLTLVNVFNSVNFFYQDEVLPQVESGDVVRESTDTSLLEEINSLQDKVKSTELFARFGIPITVTYLVKIKGYDVSKVISSLNVRFGEKKSSDVEILERMFNSSIINSPYPEDFVGLDWRETFQALTSFYKTETWWRDKDYKGNPLSKYYTLLGGK
jgi:hypothetical protein